MMKKITNILTGLFLFVAVNGVKAQASQECTMKYNLFKGNAVGKKYNEAKPDLLWLLDNCAKLSVNIYKYGTKVAAATSDHDLVKKIYEARLVNYPSKAVAKTHSNYATYLAKNKLASNEEILVILEKAYKISPKDMSVKNIYRYFEGITNKFKDTDPQKVFDTYDDVMESVGEKLDDYTKKISDLKDKEEAGTIGSKEKKRLRAYTINSSALGQVEGGLDAMISKIATCERLIPIYARDFEANKTNGVWLKRAVSRMFNKGCQADPMFEKLTRAYADVTQSADAFNFLASVLDNNGDSSGASKMRKKAFDLETDPFKKAKLKLIAAQEARGRGQYGRARGLAREALSYNRNMGKAYLLIASMYSKSANSCGTNEFEKKMVYVAALNMARKAKSVDPGSNAGRYIKSYKGLIPSKKLIFQQGLSSGASYKIGCWIGETVRIP